MDVVASEDCFVYQQFPLAYYIRHTYTAGWLASVGGPVRPDHVGFRSVYVCGAGMVVWLAAGLVVGCYYVSSGAVWFGDIVRCAAALLVDRPTG